MANGCMFDSEPLPSIALEVMIRRTTFLPLPKDEKVNFRTTSHYPTWEAALHRSRRELETQLSKSHHELLFISTVLCMKRPLQALPACKTKYTYCHGPIEELWYLPYVHSPSWYHDSIFFSGNDPVVDWMTGHNCIPLPISMPFVMWFCCSSC